MDQTYKVILAKPRQLQIQVGPPININLNNHKSRAREAYLNRKAGLPTDQYDFTQVNDDEVAYSTVDSFPDNVSEESVQPFRVYEIARAKQKEQLPRAKYGVQLYPDRNQGDVSTES